MSIAFLLFLAPPPVSLAAAPPSVLGAITASGFGGSLSVAPGSYVEIYGTNLSSTTRQWNAADFVGPNAPTSLDGVKVSIGGQPAFVCYVSPLLVNAQLPSAIGPGPQPLIVTNSAGASAPFSLTIDATQAGLWAPANYNIGGLQYVAALFPDFQTFVLPPNAVPGVPSRQARPGETIVLLGIGFGPVAPGTPAGRIASELNQLVSPLVFSFGQTPVTPAYAGLTPSAVGLYQFNLVVPPVPDSNVVPLSFTFAGAPSSQTLYTAVNASAHSGARSTATINVNGVNRFYVLYVPTNFQPGSSALVISMHGMTGTAAGQESSTHMDDKADQAGFAIAYPQSWVNYASITQWDYFYYPYWAGPAPDDTGFLRLLIDTLQATLHPDPKRIYLTGISAGAFMSHRAAVELSSRVAAIVPLSGAIFGTPFTDQRVAPPPAGPVSVLILHGDADTSVPYCGVSPDFRYAGQDQTFDYWAAADGCSTFDTAEPLCTAAALPSPIYEKRATNCLSNTEVRIFKLLGGTHSWPSTPMNDPNQVPYNPVFDSTTGVTFNDLIWNFFAAHPKP